MRRLLLLIVLLLSFVFFGCDSGESRKLRDLGYECKRRDCNGALFVDGEFCIDGREYSCQKD